jgi:hypothetical protein
VDNCISSDPKTLQKDQDKCLEIIIEALKNGSLNLIIGAGVSMSTNNPIDAEDRDSKSNIGFPNWIDLAKNCCKSASIDFDISQSSNNKYILSKLEEVRDFCKNSTPRLDFNEFVKTNLYKNVIYDINSLKTDLLIAIGALVMNSSKSSLTNVVNYNFDDILEWYLTYHGFDLQIISEINNVIYSSDTIFYHPHGFLPNSDLFSESTSKKIILSNKDYVRAKWNEDFWNSIQRNIFSSKINLFIGMSGEDTHIEDICQYSYEKVVEKERILGVMIQCIKDRNETIEKENNGNGVIIYYINNYSDLPNLLLKIVRTARGIDF